MHAKLPSHLHYSGMRYNQTGGRSRAGTYLYVSPAYGLSFQVHMARVAQTGAHYFLVELETGGPLVRVENDLFVSFLPAVFGQVVVVGPLYSHPLGLRAKAAWTAQVLPGPRRRGIISSVDPSGAYGRILAEGGGNIAVNRNELRQGTPLVRGQSVTFNEVHTGHGRTAVDVRRV